MTINELLKEKRESFDRKVKQEKGKRVHYLCMEFLVGRSFKNNLHNLELVEEFCKLFAECGYDLEEVFELEPDAGLGNGGWVGLRLVLWSR